MPDTTPMRSTSRVLPHAIPKARGPIVPAAAASHQPSKKKKKDKKKKKLSTLSFGGDEEEEEEVDEPPKKKLGKNPSVDSSFLPDKERDEALAKRSLHAVAERGREQPVDAERPVCAGVRRRSQAGRRRPSKLFLVSAF